MFGGFGQELLAARAYFVHLAIVLVPLFLLGAFLVGLLQEYLPPERVERILRRYDGGSGNVVAAGTGAITPFCSASTVPVLAGLLGAGAPLGIAFSFLLASPLVNEIAVLFLLGAFGLKVTALYVLTTFTAAVVGGIVIGRLGFDDQIKDIQPSTAGPPSEKSQPTATDGGTTACSIDGEGGCSSDAGGLTSGAAEGASSGGCCSDSTASVRRTHHQRFASAARKAWAFFVDALPYLLVGMTIGALVHGAVPVSVLQAVLGPENPFAVPLAAIVGAPVYVSTSGMLAIGASLNEQGIAIGTVLAFVVGGAGISVPNVILLNKLFERRLLAIYATTVVAIGVAVGTLLNLALA